MTNRAYAEMMRVDSFSLIRRYTHICWYSIVEVRYSYYLTYVVLQPAT